jgi:hypothetical protein
MEIQLHSFLTSALDGNKWLAPRPGCFTPGTLKMGCEGERWKIQVTGSGDIQWQMLNSITGDLGGYSHSYYTNLEAGIRAIAALLQGEAGNEFLLHS